VALSGLVFLKVKKEEKYRIADNIIQLQLIKKGLMLLNTKVQCFFCNKKLTREEIATLELSYFSICLECRKWFSKLAKKSF
jgi:hypothetical protein